ncbi:MAG: glucosaminidase domain-containing protein [Chloroflexaceae bacterium]|jgi:hypothetical protein|nr:glucosaminidase domain-containing protein [Chloroflexaceae bacterium]
MRQFPAHPWTRLALWWRQFGEAYTLTALALCAFSLPLFALLELLSWPLMGRGLLLLAWLAGGVLLLRLPRLLRSHGRRTLLAAGLGLLALSAGFATQAASATPMQLAMPAPAAVSAGSLTFVAPPRISRELFVQILQRGRNGFNSPAAPVAGDLYDIIAAYGVDPAVALAMFAHESQFCTVGVCAMYNTRNWGAQRGAVRRERVQDYVPGPFVRYHSWHDGMRDWSELILFRYVNRGLDTVDKAIPVYAPTGDGNVPSAYIASVYRMVAAWQGQVADLPGDDSLRTYKGNLDLALLSETFLAAGVEYRPSWAFHAYMKAEADAGRPLGPPIDESRLIVVNGKKYAIQTFALDTIYTPVADRESDTNWGDVRRMSDLMRNTPAQVQPAQPAPSP